jgi:hypothetical protein
MGGSKTAIFTQVVHFYSDAVGHITIGGNSCGMQAVRVQGIAETRAALTERGFI